MIGVMELIILIVLIPLVLTFFIFWLWMLIDCLKRPDDKFAIGENHAKLIWVIVIIFTGFIGAIIYFFLIKKDERVGVQRRDEEHRD